jgi:benzodiazapine receptor
MSELASAGQLRMSYVRVALVAVPLVLLLGIASGALAGSGSGNAWYAALAKPAATPPDWLFPVAWTTLYVLLGLAVSMILVARRAVGRAPAIALFVVQFAVNLAWSPLFFALHRVDLALATILLMIVLTIATVIAFARVRRRAAALMLPYLAWICFAAWLNQRIEALNPDAATLAPARPSTQIVL